MRTDLVLDALEMGIWTRQREHRDLSRLVHHSDRGVPYRAICYTDRLAEAGAVASVGSKGDGYDNALAAAVNSIFKAELIRNRGPWRGIEDLEIAAVEYIDWFNHRRLHGELGMVPPVEFEQAHYRHRPAPLRSDYRRSGTTEPPLGPGRTCRCHSAIGAPPINRLDNLPGHHS